MDVFFKELAVASGSTQSVQIDLSGGNTLLGVVIPSAISGTTLGVAVAVTSDGTFVPLKDGATDLAMTMAASKYLYIDPKYTAGIRYAKFISNTTETGARTLIAAYGQRRSQ